MSESTGNIRRIVQVRGRVQGVGFRYAVQGQAEHLGVAGTVRNLLDGTVEADIEGTPQGVEDLCSWLCTGPPTARVDGVEVREAAPHGVEGFRITG